MIRHIIAGGCSFTADGIGGAPPTADSGGNCSFTHGAKPHTWVSHVAKELGVQSLVNLAASGHGNMLTRHAITHLISNYDYDPKDTLVLINITETVRLDSVCDWHDGNRSRWIPWDPEIIPWTYHSRNSSVIRRSLRAMSLDDVQAVSAISVRQLFEDLTNMGFQFRFLMMKDFRQDAELAPRLVPYQANAVMLPGRPDMWGFCREYGYLDTDGFHPDAMGHWCIAQQVLNQI